MVPLQKSHAYLTRVTLSSSSSFIPARMEGVMSESFTFQSMIRGCHVYNEVWYAVVGETLPCQQEGGNSHDPYAVAVMNGRLIVGHVPHEISAVCYLFLRRGGTISCKVTGRRRYSADLAQGGLETPDICRCCQRPFQSAKTRTECPQL